MYSLHDVGVAGLSLNEVLGCEIVSGIGEHSTLVLLAYVDEENMLYELPDLQKIKVYLRDGGERKTIFSGVVTDIRLSEQGQMKVARIEGKSQSWLMDREKRSRSFQNTRISFKTLIQEILKSYQDEKCDFIYAVRNQAIGRLLVQYEETDWEFLKRVASLKCLVLTPDSQQEGLKFYVGVPLLAGSGFAYHVQELAKDMEAYYLLKANEKKVFAEDFTCYQVASEQLLRIFEPVTIQGKRFVACSCRYAFTGQEMTGTYRLQSAESIKAVAVYPMHLIGVALMGKVVNVSGTKIQALLEIDQNHTERAAYWFPYSTLSASTDGSGWYCMPEIGDNVRIYFPSKQEKEAVALSAVSSYTAPRDGKDRMADPDSRYLRTKDGQELALTPDYIRLSCGEGAASATIQTDGKVIVQAQAMVKAEAQEKMVLHAEEALNIHVTEQFVAHSLDGGQIVSAEGEMLIRGTQVDLD